MLEGTAANQDIAVTGGTVELKGIEEGPSENIQRYPALSSGKSITADPAKALSRAGWHAEVKTKNASGDWTDISGSPSNEAIAYSGTANAIQALIVAGALVEPEPEPDPEPDPKPRPSGGGGTSTYAVVYKANYENGPADVRDSGYRSGEKVTVKDGGIFKAPEGLRFAGWAETAAGTAKYQPGNTFDMPAKTLTLYAVWSGQDGPALNKTDHIAYPHGYPDGNVKPQGHITREETAMIFYRLLFAESQTRYHSTASPFSDVANSRWSATAIATLAKAGLMKGQTETIFAPKAPITRAEFAAVAARFDSEAYSGPNLFKDISGHWAADLINRAAHQGWVQGDKDGFFRPDDLITRAEAAALINRMLERAPETAADLLEGMKTFHDNQDTAKWYYLDIQEAANGHEYNRKADGVHESWTKLK